MENEPPTLGPPANSSEWTDVNIGGMEFLCSSSLDALPGVVHGFTKRFGGVSIGQYSSLNLGFHVGDNRESVVTNREIVLNAVGFKPENLVTAEQVHGSGVAIARGCVGHISGVDALVTDISGLLLLLLFADCVPVYIADPIRRVVAIAHSGWRGTELNVVQATLVKMTAAFGTEPSDCVAAIGPCIGASSYEVSTDVASRFFDAPFDRIDETVSPVLTYNKKTEKYSLNLRQMVFIQLVRAGLNDQRVAVSNQCTYTNEKEFFSHRRDGVGGQSTGRMAAIIGLRPKACSMENR
jgi:polyphenol oxidase